MSDPTEGLFHDYPELEYHAHPALSYSTGKHYLRSPAHYLHAVQNREEKAAFDLGHAVHAKVLGEGMDAAEIPDDVLASNGAASTKAAKEFVADARAKGQVPLKRAVIEQVSAMADAVLTHPEARKYLDLPGAPEVSMFGTDPESKVSIRGRVDYLPDAVKGARTFPIDLKTTTNATTQHIIRRIADYDYDLQAAMYRHLIHLTRGDTTGPMIQIYVETEPPHGVTVVQIAHEDWIEGGQIKLHTILQRHAACVAANQWPGYPIGTHAIEPAPWYLNDIYRIEEAS